MSDHRVTAGASGAAKIPEKHSGEQVRTDHTDSKKSGHIKPSSERGLEGSLAKAHMFAGPVQAKAKAPEYPVSDKAIAAETNRAARLQAELPHWEMNDKKLFLMHMEPGDIAKGEPFIKTVIPNDAQIANAPLVRIFNENTHGAQKYFDEAQTLFSLAKDYLTAGDQQSAQECFDQGRALEHCGATMKNRNEQWLQLRRDHRDDALAKHAGNMQEFLFASVSALGADAAAGELAFRALSKSYTLLKGGLAGIKGAANLERIAQLRELAKASGQAPEVLAKGSLARLPKSVGAPQSNAERLVELESLLSRPEQLAKTDPEELVRLSRDPATGNSLTPAEANQLIETARNLPEYRIAQSEALGNQLMSNFEFARPEDREAVQAMLASDQKLVNAHPEALARMCQISEGDARMLISGADLRINRELDKLSLRKALGNLQAKAAAGDKGAEKVAGQIETFVRGLEAHQKMMLRYGQSFPDTVKTARKCSPEYLQNKYGLASLEEGQKLKAQLEQLPDKFSFPAHDLWGPAGKNRTSIARLLGRDTRPADDLAVAYAMHRHNLQFSHHNPNDPMSMLECALDKVDAMRDTTRAYRNFQPMEWDVIGKELDKTNDESLRIMEKFVQVEVRRLQEHGMAREVQQGFPTFHPGSGR